jgi:hypothetical protein
MAEFHVSEETLTLLLEKLEQTPRGLRPVDIPGTLFEFLVKGIQEVLRLQIRLAETTEASKNFLEALRSYYASNEEFVPPICAANEQVFRTDAPVETAHEPCLHFATHRLVCEGDDMLVCDFHADKARRANTGELQEFSYAPELRELNRFLKLRADHGPGPIEEGRQQLEELKEENAYLKSRLEEALHMGDTWARNPHKETLDDMVRLFPPAYDQTAHLLMKYAYLAGRTTEALAAPPPLVVFTREDIERSLKENLKKDPK